MPLPLHRKSNFEYYLKYKACVGAPCFIGYYMVYLFVLTKEQQAAHFFTFTVAHGFWLIFILFYPGQILALFKRIRDMKKDNSEKLSGSEEKNLSEDNEFKPEGKKSSNSKD